MLRQRALPTHWAVQSDTDEEVVVPLSETPVRVMNPCALQVGVLVVGAATATAMVMKEAIMVEKRILLLCGGDVKEWLMIRVVDYSSDC